MKIVERREHGGYWWGRDTEGAWYRWNTATSGWEGPAAPPWPPDPPPLTPEEEAIVAEALASTTAPAGHFNRFSQALSGSQSGKRW